MATNDINKQLNERTTTAERLRREIRERKVQLAGVEAEIAALSKLVPGVGNTGVAEAAPTERSLQDLIVEFVRASATPVRTKQVQEHLSSHQVTYSPGSVSALLSRLAQPGAPLCKVTRGLYAPSA